MDDEGTWTANNKAEDDVVSRVFCIHKTSLALLRAHSYILVTDCTYNTNKYKMPLLDIVGITSLNTSFYVGFCFVAEDFNHYEFALRCLGRDIFKT
jgi:MULE transposase domain